MLSLHGLTAFFEIFFWLSLAVVFYAYFGYPLLLWLLSKVIGKEARVDSSHTPSVSLMILAYNEESGLERRLENALKTDYPKNKLEIIVVSNGSTDATDEIAGRYVSKGVRLISYPEPGKTNAQNRAIGEASGEIVVFTDADTIFRQDAVRNLASYFADERVGVVCGRLAHAEAVNALVGRGEGFFRRYDNKLKELESRLGSCITGSGCILSIRKRLYEEIDPSLTEDFILPVRALFRGYMSIFAHDAISFEWVTEEAGEEFGRKTRTIIQGSRAFFYLLSLSALRSPLVLLEMLSRKLLRWLAPLFLVAAFVSTLFLLASGFYQLLFALQLLFYGSAALGCFLERMGLRVRFLYIPYYFCLVNAAAPVGLFSMLRGKKLSTWEKIESTRS